MVRSRLPLLILMAMVACGVPGDKPVDRTSPAGPLVWPLPPAQPRIEYLYSFHTPADLGIRPPFFTRMWDAIAGAENREMLKPYAIAADGDRLAVADPGLAVIHLFDTKKRKYRRIARAGSEALRSPVAAVFGADRLFVADSGLGKVFAFDARGETAFTIGGIERPTGLAYDPDQGRLYVADTLAHRIVVFDETGRRLFSFGRRGGEAGSFNYPTHLFLRAGRLYVNDTMNFRLQVYDPEGNFVSSFGRHGDGTGDFSQPKGVGADQDGHVYVADAMFDAVQIFDADGNFLLAFGKTGAGAGDFWLPGGLFVAGDRIYVADTYNRRVQVFRFLGGDS